MSRRHYLLSIAINRGPFSEASVLSALAITRDPTRCHSLTFHCVQVWAALQSREVFGIFFSRCCGAAVIFAMMVMTVKEQNTSERLCGYGCDEIERERF